MPMNHDPWQEGFTAGEDGEGFDDCPYDEGSVDWLCWRNGFYAALEGEEDDDSCDD